MDEEGIDREKLDWVMDLKNNRRGRIHEYAEKYHHAMYLEGERPWSVKCDVALPCATENEISDEEASALLQNGCTCVAEGANMPSTPGAVERFLEAGVAVSGLEMTQNSMRLSWSRHEVDERLSVIMKEIHRTCVKYGKQGDFVNYVDGANIGGFIKVADAMMDQGLL